ncbi:hypothetical protein VrSk94_11190 [Vibrio rotiferianus]
MNGVCALCHKSEKLIDSHFMPKAIYRSISKGHPEHGQNIVWISGHEKSAAYTSKQAKKHLLCSNCEALFSKNGEGKVLPLMAKPNGFKLATKIKKFKKLSGIKDEIWYFPPNDDSALGFMYFAVSIAWRLSSTDWSNYGMPKTKNSIRKESMQSFSKFLLGKTELPCNTYLAVYVDNQKVDTPSMSFPTVKNHVGYQHIVFNIPGLKFSLLTGSNTGSGIHETFAHNETNVYFVSRSLKTHADYSFVSDFIKNTAVAKGRLAKELSAKNA